MLRTPFSCLVILPAILAHPLDLNPRQDDTSAAPEPWDAGKVTEFTIHESCNATQTRQLQSAFEETFELAQHAMDHTLRWANNSAIYRKYFGDGQPYEVIGAFATITKGDKAGLVFRCDDPDGVCEATTWGGHWRGSNATNETVLCSVSFEERRPLNQVCALGYTVSQTSRLIFWASDMIHRVLHLPSIGRGYIEHYTEGWAGAIEAAAQGNPNVTHDSDVLQYYALEAYAYDIVAPGEGCPGPQEIIATESSAAAAAAATATATATAVDVPSSTTDAPENCHTHENGEEHCD